MIETRQLCKRYGRFTAVDRIEFTVQPGQVRLSGPGPRVVR